MGMVRTAGRDGGHRNKIRTGVTGASPKVEAAGNVTDPPTLALSREKRTRSGTLRGEERRKIASPQKISSKNKEGET